MGSYKLLIKRSAEREIRALPLEHRGRVVSRIQELAENPRPDGCRKLSGRNAYRIRVGNYRIVYSIQDADLIVEVVKVGHRKDVYR